MKNKLALVLVGLVALSGAWYGLTVLRSPTGSPFGAQGTETTVAATDMSTRSESLRTVPKIKFDNLRVKEIGKLDLDCNPTVAPDGEHYTCGQSDGLWYGSFANGLEKRLLDVQTHAFWLPDGKRLTYFDSSPPGQPDELRILDLTTGVSSIIAEVGSNSDGQIQVVSNEQIFFSQSGELVEWNASDGSVKSASPFAKGQIDGLNWKLSPDGRLLATQSNTNEIATLSIVNRENGKSVFVTNKIDEAFGAFVWSPDGSQLYYSTVDPQSRIPELWRVSADGSQLKLIWHGPSRGAFERLTWMPDGQTLLLIHARKTSSAEIDDTFYAVDTITGNQKTLFMNGSGITLFNGGKSLLFQHNMTERATYVAELEW